MKSISRRDFLKVGGFALFGTAGAIALNQKGNYQPHSIPASHLMQHGDDIMPGTVGEVDHESNGFNPTDILTDFDYGKVSSMPDGRILREYEIIANNKEIEILPGIKFPAWTYNGRIPGPTLRCTEGDHIRITFQNGSDHPHTMHFHGIHAGIMDGVPGTGPGGNVQPG